MRKTSFLLSVLATVLLSSALFAVAAAQEGEIGGSDPSYSPDSSSLPEPSTKPDEVQSILPRDNATAPDSSVSSGDEILYTTQGNNTDLLAPGAEDANLLAANTTAPDNTLAFAAIAVLSIVIVSGALGVVYYRRSASKEQI